MSELVRVPVPPYRETVFDVHSSENVSTLITGILVRFYTEKPTSEPLSTIAVELVKGKLWVLAVPDVVVKSPAVDNRAEVTQ